MKYFRWNPAAEELLLYHYGQGRTSKECAMFLSAHYERPFTPTSIERRLQKINLSCPIKRGKISPKKRIYAPKPRPINIMGYQRPKLITLKTV